MSVTEDGQLVNDISSLLKHSNINDVTIMLNDGIKVEANKVVLIARSKFFSRLFREENPAPTKIKIEISASKHSLDLIIEYFYTGKMDFSSLNFSELVDLTNLLKFMEMDLFSIVEQHICVKVEDREFQLTSLLESTNILEKYNLTKLISIVIEHLDNEFEEVSKLMDVKHLSPVFLEQLLQKRLGRNIEVNSDIEHESDEVVGSENEFGSNEEEHVATKNQNKTNDDVDILNHLVEEIYQVNEFNVFINWLNGNVDCNESFKIRIAKLFDLKKFPPEYLVCQVRSSSLYDDAEIFKILSQSATQMKSEIKVMKRTRMEMEKEIKSLRDSHYELKASHKRLVKEKVLKMEKRRRGDITGYF